MNATSGPVLRDIHLPPPPGWWPPAPGWWMLAGIAVILIAFALHRLRKRFLVRRHLRAVLRELDRCIDENRHDPAALAAALSQFLRRLALGDESAAAAYAGERWLAWLDARAAQHEFSGGVGRVLIEAPFRAQPEYDVAALIALVRRYTRSALDAGAAHA